MAASKNIRKTISSTILKARKNTTSASNNKLKTRHQICVIPPNSARHAAYQSLYLLNLYGKEIVHLLTEAKGTIGVSRRMSGYYQALIQEVCSLASQDILEFMDEVEINNAFRCSQVRQQHERRLFS